MGWLWGSSDHSNASKSKDPVRDLDPDLRDFLKKEAPQKYEAKTTPPPPPERTIPKPAIAEDQFEDDSKPKVPPQSLYQDGRYAHIWKNYKSLSEVEAEGKSDQERMMDVMESHRTRQAELGRAALESCAVEQMEVSDCFRAGGWSAKTTMCRAENRKFDRCYTMQAKFLKALGYLAAYDRPDVEEQIQMQADTLYHQMLDQEKAIETAKAEGKPIPAFPALLKAQMAKANVAQDLEKPEFDISSLAPRSQNPLKKRLEKFEGVEREIEELAIKAEVAAAAEMSGKIDHVGRQQLEERELRKAQGRETIADKVYYAFRAKLLEPNKTGALIPQIIINHRRHNTTGLQPSMMLLWAIAGVPLGAYNIAGNFNVALLIQPQILTVLSLVTWGQCGFYDDAGIDRDIHWPVILMGVVSAILLSAGVLRHYWDIYTHRTVRGISFIFVAIDAAGDVFSLVSIFFQPKLDILGMVIYASEFVLWCGVFACGGYFNLRPWVQQKISERALRRVGMGRQDGEGDGEVDVDVDVELERMGSSTSVFRTSGSVVSERRGGRAEG
ncbi:hypothetical protein GLAREA_13041 [Glarea lozoyensis ATCC 20868]|uniref:Uncharacterized protein n=1 Tax=Glarea lozoyensis (strain ATCC 20868 / MF5171) TaxID=1116229 RepID=S3DVB7_GLAL2|nr:uncharacterized protein GLAREA_13041 [Glarea lozoyensis ATCC 20868]EPE30318.1 hypothetical protein GLAREA_13041 [Glarea lozoyensis ATCC 20868]